MPLMPPMFMENFTANNLKRLTTVLNMQQRELNLILQDIPDTLESLSEKLNKIRQMGNTLVGICNMVEEEVNSIFENYSKNKESYTRLVRSPEMQECMKMRMPKDEARFDEKKALITTLITNAKQKLTDARDKVTTWSILGLQARQMQTQANEMLEQTTKAIIDTMETIAKKQKEESNLKETTSFLLKNNSLFKSHENSFLIDNRHNDAKLQHEYDKQYGLVARK